MSQDSALEDLARRAAEAGQRAADAAREAASAASDYTQVAAGTFQDASQGVLDPFMFQFTTFVMAIFVGYYVVWSVTPALHTPLMAVTNAISSVIVVGALLAVSVSAAGALDGGPIWARVFGFIALVLASVNIVGGFLVTQRMLGMYQKRQR